MAINDLGTEAYKEELEGELLRLLISNKRNPSEYKTERIERLKSRLGEKDESNKLLD